MAILGVLGGWGISEIILYTGEKGLFWLAIVFLVLFIVRLTLAHRAELRPIDLAFKYDLKNYDENLRAGKNVDYYSTRLRDK